MTGDLTKKHIFLPFLYFFTLSIGMIVLLAVWANTDARTMSQIYAQEDYNQDDYVMVMPEDDTVYEIEEESVENDNIAKQIDSFFANNNAPIAGHGAIFTEEARKNEIDPTIVAAIAHCESSGGKVTPQFGGEESYNAWGYGVFDNNNTTKNMNAYSMGSFENGIEIMSRAIKKYYDRGLVEPHEIVTRYTPASVRLANGDATQAPWTLCITGTISKILSQEIDEDDTSL